MVIYRDNLAENNCTELEYFREISERRLMMADHPAPGIFIAESPLVIGRALDAGYEPLAFLVDIRLLKSDENTAAIIGKCREDVKVFAAPESELKCIRGFPMTRGMLCAMRRMPNKTVSEVCRGLRRIAVLDNVQNPTNVGAIVRSAAALGIEAVLLNENCADPLYRRAARVSMGTVFQIPWTYTGGNYLKNLKELGFFTCAMALRDDSVSPDDPIVKGKDKIAVILGSEGYGLEEDIINACDATVRIPMTDGIDSLNVAAASAVAFWELGLMKEAGLRN